MKTRWQLVAIMTMALAMAGVGCSNNQPVQLRYETERLYHQASRALEKASIRPDLTPEQALNEAGSLFNETVTFALAALESVDETANPVEYKEIQHLAFQASSRLEQLQFHARHYHDALGTMERLLSVETLTDMQALATKLNLGQALQGSQQWDSAVVVYHHVIDTYYPPVDNNGDVLRSLLQLPYQVYRVFKLIGEEGPADAEYERAREYYQRLADEMADTPAGRMARTSLARLYDDTGQWEKEIEVLKVVREQADPNFYLPVSIHIADLYANRLNKPSEAMALYQQLIDDLLPSDSVVYPALRYKVAKVHMTRGEYDEARQILQDLKENYRRYYGLNPMAQYALARSFELEGNWTRAEVEYNYLIENYRVSDEALSTFLYIAGKLKEQGRTAESERWYRDAEEHYKQLVAVHAGTIVEAKALAYQADLYRERNQWDQTATTLLRIFDRFPDSEPGRRALLRASGVYRERLNQPAKADSLIEVFKAAVAKLTAEGAPEEEESESGL